MRGKKVAEHGGKDLLLSCCSCAIKFEQVCGGGGLQLIAQTKFNLANSLKMKLLDLSLLST